MISQLTGTVAHAGTTWFVIDVAGVGYRALCTPDTAAALRPGEVTTVHTSLVVREDSLTLFGFGTEAEREMFELVQAPSGVGPKVALAICSVLSPGDLRRAVTGDDTRAISRAPGVGPKMAQKIILELRDKAALLALDDSSTVTGPPQGDQAWREQVTEGLQGLGWSAKDAAAACDAIAEQAATGASIRQLMRAALSSLAKR
ncbi:Holliday junction branch migration protein RuvA [Arachnia propionica]|uniref:Holliday junction branch migration complex subunit RuvA n=1 Tax=Arachnia propionica TaxID=1750 RepID=A0A3P1TDA8_9ACTN|nr:Holliday junction branch migration protein RuvA [Arachnia propionica]MDO5081930.1 Holliday junction branch migration protein RuvA [Arachnia propionica]RRD07220.1 Holliday junction branch migration protein RuvA [Arachnia propionica]